jgi:hypothetical protein
MEDPQTRQILVRALGIGDAIKVPCRHFYRAPENSPVLRHCHRMADAGLLYFCPGPNMPSFFLVTQAGAHAVGTKLVDEEARIMMVLANSKQDPKSAFDQWKAAVRHAQISGGPIPAAPGTSGLRPGRAGADANAPSFAQVA